MTQDPGNEQDGFDADDDTPTETPGTEREEPQAAPEAPAAPKYLTQADIDELWNTRAAELKATQEAAANKAFGKLGEFERWKSERIASESRLKTVRDKFTPEKIAVIREDLPEIADMMEIVVGLPGIPVGSASVDPAKVEALVQQRLTPMRQDLAMQMLELQHPDLAQVDASPEFHAWRAALPADEQAALAAASDAYDARVVSRYITRFKSTAKPASPKAKSRFDAAVTPRGSGTVHTQVGTDERAGFDSA
jgi:hypothetical protein